MTPTFKISETSTELCFVKAPEDGKTNHLANLNTNPVIIWQCDDDEIIFNRLSQGNWQLLGKTSELKEEDLEEVMPITMGQHYINLNSKSLSERWVKSAKESLLSLMDKLEIYENNPYKDDWDELCTWGHGDFSKDGKSSIELFKEAEERTGTWILLIRKLD